MGKTVMIIGSGGRSHAISEAYERSSLVDNILLLPGNDLCSYKRKKDVICIKNIELTDFNSIVEVAKKYKVDLIDITRSEPLSKGISDILRENGLNVFGPSKFAVRIESDKVFARNFMKKWNIPSPKFDVFSDEMMAIEYVRGIYRYDSDKKLFIKASGLCDGKGVFLVENFEQAVIAIKKMKQFGHAGEVFLVEDGIDGEEISISVISDGKNYHILKTAHNDKHTRNYDQGPISRGVGSNSPVLSLYNDDILEEIEQKIIRKSILGLNHEKTPFVGILTAVLMITNEQGKMVPKVIEFNARYGNPEAQVILPGIKTDYYDIVDHVLKGKLDKIDIVEDSLYRFCVVGCSRGYPGNVSHVKGKMIHGIKEVFDLDGVSLYGSNLYYSNDRFYVAGGRLFHIVGASSDLLDAKTKAYCAISRIYVEGNNLQYRTDIAWKDVEIEYMRRI